MSELQAQARALGDPTRHALFRYLLDAPEPVGIAELTEHLGVHHNAVRQHLAKLVDAGLVVETTQAPTGRGRPRLQYRAHPAADARWGGLSPYERLAVLLAEVIRTGDDPVEVGRRAGRALAHPVPPGGDPIEDLTEVIEWQGFDPVIRRRGPHATITLERCPFTAAVLTDAATVCDLHLGLAQGLADGIGGVVVEELEVRAPQRAGCTLRCQLTEPLDGRQ